MRGGLCLGTRGIGFWSLGKNPGDGGKTSRAGETTRASPSLGFVADKIINIGGGGLLELNTVLGPFASFAVHFEYLRKRSM